MRRYRPCLITVLITLILIGAMLTSTPVGAITYGFVDTTNAYSNTGAFIIKSPMTGEIFPICSGTLIAPDVFLTAGHCTQSWHQKATRLTSALISRFHLAI